MQSALGFVCEMLTVLSLTASPPSCYRLLDYYYPIRAGNQWDYDGTDWDGAPSKTHVQVDNEALPLTFCTGRDPVQTYVRNVVSLYSAYGEYEPGGAFVPTDTWYDYVTVDGAWGMCGDDDDPGEAELRADGCFVFPEQMCIGQPVTLVRDMYFNCGFVGEVSFTLEVLGNTSVTVPAGTYPDCLHLRFSVDPGFDPFVYEEWWAKGVGIVKHRGVSGPGQLEEQDLISFKIWRPLLISISLTSPALSLSVSGPSGTNVQVQYVTNLSAENSWINLTNIVLSNTPSVIETPNIGSSRSRFYRVHLGDPIAANPTNTMVYILPGTFTMGSPEGLGNDNERPQTEVTISRGFWMGTYEVTQREYQDVVGANPSYFAGDLNRPVETVNWYDATNYCALLTSRERSAGRLPDGYEYRLPTEAQWEYACRAGTTTLYSYGDDEGALGDYAWYDVNSGGTTHAAGQKRPNGWGLYDMHGNVWEWCMDWDGTYPGGSVTDPTGPDMGSYHLVRGGGWDLFAYFCRSASRIWGDPVGRGNYLGFRVVLVSVP